MRTLYTEIEKKLKNFDLRLKFQMDGGTLGILGASGCGKSMTLKSVAGIVEPDGGKIYTEKAVFYDKAKHINLPPQKRKVGYLFQNYALFPNMTVEDNILAGFSGSRESKRWKKEQAGKLIRQFHLDGLENQYPMRLSGGQQQRTALARILASAPDILLLDEPFSAMDSYLKEELQIDLGKRLAEFGGCTVIVSHDRDEIYKLCSHTMIMENGRNVICEETKKLFEQPRFAAAARLTGCKNIAKAERIGPQRVRALDWGVDFTVDGEIPEKLAYVGVRAHDFVPFSGEDTENVIRVLPGEWTEAPFEWTLLFQNQENPMEKMWMKRERGSRQIPEKVRVARDKILLLEE